MNDPNRLPPQSLEAELCILGALLLNNDSILDVAPNLGVEDFYRDTHQVVYRAIRDLLDRGTPVDSITLVEELKRRGEFEKAGGDETIRKALEETPHAANAKYHAEIVHQLAIKRALIQVAHQILEKGYSNLFDSDQLCEFAERQILAIGRSGANQEPRSIAVIADEEIERMLARKEDRMAGGLMTGLVDLDSIIGGFQPGQMIVLAARPSMGKTALAFGMGVHAAARLNVGVLFISLEMSRSEIGRRFLSLRSGVQMSKVQQPCFMGPDDIERIRAAAASPDTPLWIDDSSALTPSQVSAMARRLEARHGIGLLGIDYLQLVSPENG